MQRVVVELDEGARVEVGVGVVGPVADGGRGEEVGGETGGGSGEGGVVEGGGDGGKGVGDLFAVPVLGKLGY